jgi:uncharacterized protein (TIGR02270 family)
MDPSKVSEKALLYGPVSQKGFYTDLYLEHLEESSFLYEQRSGLFSDPEISWTDIEDFEERFEAHIDALVIGKNLALDVCLERAINGDTGELHSAVRVFCRHKRMEYLQRALEAADLDEDNKRSITDALKHELPETWQGMIRKMLLCGEMDLIKMAATVTGFKRLAFADELLTILQDHTIEPLPEVIRAIGRLKENRAQHLLTNMLNVAGGKIAYEIALALLRLGNFHILDDLVKAARENQWPLLLIGISGNKEHVSVLHDLHYQFGSAPDLLLALGFLGDISSIPILLDNLLDAKSGGSAAIALNLITGANLYDEAFIPEDLDEDTLFEEEIKKAQRGEPLTEDDDPPGTYISQPSRNIDAWNNWWKANSKSFGRSTSYRNGKPFSHACIIENLLSENSPHIVREMAHEEWVIKSGNSLHFEVDFRVSMQKKILSHIGSVV